MGKRNGNRCDCGAPCGQNQYCRTCGEDEIESIQERYHLRGSLTFSEAMDQVAQICRLSGLNPAQYRV